MNAASPLVTIIAVCYNHARFVLECLESIRRQTYAPVQLVIMDDCSKDESVALIRRWIEDSGMHCHFVAHSVNRGLCNTLNEALTLATGKYISIVATDDMLLPDKLEHQVRLLEDAPPSVGAVYSDALQMDEQGAPLPSYFIESHAGSPHAESGNLFPRLLKGNFLPAMTLLIRRECIDQVGSFDANLAYEDWDMWLRIAREYEFVHSPTPSAQYRVVATSLARTAVAPVSPLLHRSNFRIMLKVLAMIRPGEILESRLARKWLADSATWLYRHDVERNHVELRQAATKLKSPRFAVYAILSRLGVKHALLKRLVVLRNRLVSYVKWRFATRHVR